MAGSALDVVTIDLIKDELRIPASTDSQDALLQNQIEAAVSFVSHGLSGPLVDRTEKYYLQPPAMDAPLIFAASAFKEISEIKYWTTSGSLRLDPDGTIPVSDLGRLHFARYDWQTHALYGPVDGWPDVLPDSLFELTCVRGIDIDAESASLRSAVILCVRQLYEGYRQIRMTEAFMRITAPYRSRGYVSRDGAPNPNLRLP